MIRVELSSSSSSTLREADVATSEEVVDGEIPAVGSATVK